MRVKVEAMGVAGVLECGVGYILLAVANNPPFWLLSIEVLLEHLLVVTVTEVGALVAWAQNVASEM